MRALLLSLLLMSVPAWGAFSYIASASGGPAGTTPAIDSTGATLLVVVVALDAGAGTRTVGDNVGGYGNTYTLAKTVTSVGGGINEIYYCVNPAHVGSGHTFTVASANSYPSIYAAAYSGSAASPLDSITNSATISSGTSIQPGSITPSCTNELVIAGLMAEAGTPTVSGATLRQARATQSGSFGGALADSIQTSKTAINPIWSFSSGHAGATIVAFRAVDSVCAGAVRHRVIGGE